MVDTRTARILPQRGRRPAGTLQVHPHPLLQEMKTPFVKDTQRAKTAVTSTPVPSFHVYSGQTTKTLVIGHLKENGESLERQVVEGDGQ
ncbi:hypothetical protein CDAR_619371 [Caerostris darwini]|uniref:Uncharacterized protein n=1 Tax=Caerostris darwini TaxID=1538125 RepID=A0AAV4PXK2_9ARAC|nr:hypothetical protein CDAR_619371 [Caerostris darwini]